MKNRSALSSVLILFLLITIGIILYFYLFSSKTVQSNTPSYETKLYTNEKYDFSIEYPANWTIHLKDNPTDNINSIEALTLSFYAAPEGEPVGDAFYGQLSIVEGVTDLNDWFKNSREITDQKVRAYVDVVNDAYGYDYLKYQDISYKVLNSSVKGMPAIVQTEKITCPDSPSCHMLGWPVGYEKWVSILYKTNAINFYVTTYTESEDTKKFDDIVNSLKFY